MTPPSAADGVELIAAAIGEADAAFGYSFNMTRLVDGIATHTLVMDGFEPVDFDDREDGYALIAERRNRLRADAIIAAWNTRAIASQAPPAGEDTVAFVQDWLMNADYDPTQFDKDFAAAIDARCAALSPPIQEAVAGEQERCARIAEGWQDGAFATDHENRIARSIAAAIRSTTERGGVE